MDRIIEVTGLKKSYKNVHAVRDISFYVERGKLFAFLGPNGAGKSTTIDILCTLLKPDAGEIVIDGNRAGERDAAIRGEIGVVFQTGVLDERLTVRENLQIRGRFYKMSTKDLGDAVERVAASAGTADFIGQRYGTLSGGQRRRADIARALIGNPRILFLDEPTTGLDPQTRKNIWETVRSLQRDHGTTVFLTTHYMEEAADADYVIVIDGGKIAARGTPEELERRYSRDTLCIKTSLVNEAAKRLGGMGLEYSVREDRVTVFLSSTVEAADILPPLRDLLEHIEIKSGTMDDAFIGITGKEIRE